MKHNPASNILTRFISLVHLPHHHKKEAALECVCFHSSALSTQTSSDSYNEDKNNQFFVVAWSTSLYQIADLEARPTELTFK